MITLSRREKRYRLAYLLILFFVTAGLLISVIFHNSGAFSSDVAALDKDYLKQEADYNMRQKEAVPIYDTLFTRIAALQNVQATAIAETDIKNGINTLYSFNEFNPNKDPRFAAFSQMALFLKIYLEDMLVLKKKMENIDRFAGQLSQCEIGFKDQQTLMNQRRARRWLYGRHQYAVLSAAGYLLCHLPGFCANTC